MYIFWVGRPNGVYLLENHVKPTWNKNSIIRVCVCMCACVHMQQASNAHVALSDLITIQGILTSTRT